MRLWSLHPQYLDAKGLVALWRESLLALAVLEGKTIGYKHHPQLLRFRNHPSPPTLLHAYLTEVWTEAQRRGYQFDSSKIRLLNQPASLPLTKGQLLYEWQHLKRKLYRRDRKRYLSFSNISLPSAHPLFYLIDGPVAEWEIQR